MPKTASSTVSAFSVDDKNPGWYFAGCVETGEVILPGVWPNTSRQASSSSPEQYPGQDVHRVWQTKLAYRRAVRFQPENSKIPVL